MMLFLYCVLSSITINNLKELANYRIGMVQDYNNGDVIEKLVKDNVISNIQYSIYVYQCSKHQENTCKKPFRHSH